MKTRAFFSQGIAKVIPHILSNKFQVLELDLRYKSSIVMIQELEIQTLSTSDSEFPSPGQICGDSIQVQLVFAVGLFGGWEAK